MFLCKINRFWLFLFHIPVLNYLSVSRNNKNESLCLISYLLCKTLTKLGHILRQIWMNDEGRMSETPCYWPRPASFAGVLIRRIAISPYTSILSKSIICYTIAITGLFWEIVMFIVEYNMWLHSYHFCCSVTFQILMNTLQTREKH